MRIGLIACGSSKISRPSPASDLYIGGLFRKRIALVRARGLPFYILSAKHGIVLPGTIIAPYDVTLSKLSVDERRAWTKRIEESAIELTAPGDEIVVLAGAEYKKWIPRLRNEGRRIICPFELPLGKQMAALKREIEGTRK